jgi:hypothetical protein
MNIKHSKYKNTGLVFELLVKQIASDTIAKENSPAIAILKRHFSGRSSLVSEFKLYQLVLKNNSTNQSKAEAVLSTITELSRKIDRDILKKQKYNLIADIKESYNLDEFFSINVVNYKALAALYCLLEAQNNEHLVDPQYLVDNKTTILEYLTKSPQNKEEVKDTLIEEFSKYDKDLKLLTFKILLEKFNNKYKDLLPEQKSILKEFITSVNSKTRLRNIYNTEVENIKNKVSILEDKVVDKVVKIKLNEVAKSINTVSNKKAVKDSDIVNLMLYYELVNELTSI